MRLTVALGLANMLLPVALWAQAIPQEAQFRGCDHAGWCHFKIDGLQDPLAVRVDGTLDENAETRMEYRVAWRDRMNALMSSMIHQHKRIELFNLRAIAPEGFAASVSVNGEDLAMDPVLLELRAARRPR